MGSAVVYPPPPPKSAFMNIGSYFRIDGILLAGAVGLYLQACDGAYWELGKMDDVGHLLQSHVFVEGIRTGAEAVAVNWIEAVDPGPDIRSLGNM
jgi:hypothetical protein